MRKLFYRFKRKSNPLAPIRRSSSCHHYNLQQLEPRLLLSGTTYVVDSLLDTVASDGQLTLREAIEAANTNAAVEDAAAGSATEEDQITFDSALFSSGPVTITLGGSEILITDELSIAGPGQNLFTIDANQGSRIFNINVADIPVSISDLSFTNGRIGYGGAIANKGQLTLINTHFHNNTATLNGGAIRSNDGSLNIINSTFTLNSASSHGGAIFKETSSLTATNTIFLANTANKNGGAIHNLSGGSTINNSTISGNIANNGGGFFATHTVSRSIIQLSTSIAHRPTQTQPVHLLLITP